MKIRKKHIVIVLILVVILTGWFYFIPIVENKPEPNMNIDISAFINAGCIKEKDYLNCSSINLEKKYTCNRIAIPSKYLGGLTPKVSIAECISSLREGNEFFKSLQQSYKYIISDNGSFKVIRTKEEFKKFFAPVETPEEALSFAVSFTGSYPKYDTTIPKYFRFFVAKIDATHVEETEEGFKVNLFKYKVYGCGTHPTYAVDYIVTRAGEVKGIQEQKIYEDPTWIACVD